jgi:hypothetical protein
MPVAYRPPLYRPSYEARRRAARRAGHIRLAVLSAGLVVLIIIISLVVSSGSSGPAATGPGQHKTTTSTTQPQSGTTSAKGVPGVVGQLLSWHLDGSLSRSVVLPAADGQSLIVVGGLDASGSSGQGIYDVNSSSGTPIQVGNLVAPVYNAGGCVLSGKGYVFGGASTTTPLTTVQVLPNLGGTATTTTTAASLGPLPLARSEESAVTIGTTAYLVGGFDGTTVDPAVIATTDGTHFSTVASLKVAVRDAAVAVLDGRIYVFGGIGASGDPVDTVQMIDPGTHSASIVGALPSPLAGAAAATLNGVIYVAGGEKLPSTNTASKATDSVWAWLSTSNSAVLAGHLGAAVAYAGMTVIGQTAWLVGGESAPNTLVDDVQTFTPSTTVTVSTT